MKSISLNLANYVPYHLTTYNRFFTLKQAQTFNISGWVKNEDNGDVRAYEEGDRESLYQFIKYLKRGPVFARVDDVNLNWESEDKTYNEFNIL